MIPASGKYFIVRSEDHTKNHDLERMSEAEIILQYPL